MDLHAQLRAQLARLRSEGGDANRLLLSAGRRWVQLSGARGQPGVLIEISAGRHLPKSMPLDIEAEQALWELGYRRPNRAAALARLQNIEDDAQAAQLCTELLDVTYRILRMAEQGAPKVELYLAAQPALHNEQLLQLMAALSKDRSMHTRQRIYGLLSRAELLVALKRQTDEALSVGCSLALHSFGDLGGYPVVGVFTDYDHLRLQDPRILPHQVVSGAVLFPLLSERRVGSLMINPAGGEARGELYRNEIDAITEHLRQRAVLH